MDSTNSNNTKSTKRKIVDQLVQGYEFATQLQLLLSHHHIDQTRIFSGSDSVSCDPDPADELLAKILGTFDKSISVLESFHPLSLEASRNNASCGDDSVTPSSCNGGDSGESSKRLGVVCKGKRGCYTRKKRSHTMIVEAKTTQDRYAWRKYGQKEILNTKFPRSYFRCTNKPTQGCKAIKHVQKKKQDPETFQITYIGYHTCTFNDQTQAKTESFNHEIIMESDNTLAATFAQNQEKSISSVKEEENNNGENKEYCEGSSTGEDLSLVWQEDMMMFDDHQNYYYYGETNASTSHHFAFTDNYQFSTYYE